MRWTARLLGEGEKQPGRVARGWNGCVSREAREEEEEKVPRLRSPRHDCSLPLGRTLTLSFEVDNKRRNTTTTHTHDERL